MPWLKICMNTPLNAVCISTAGQHHRNADGRGLKRNGQPRVKQKERHFHREPKKDSGKGKPGDVAAQQSLFSETGELSEVECSHCEINSEKREQHRNTAEKS